MSHAGADRAITSTSRENQEKIPDEEYAKCRGQWIAVHPNETHIVASHHDLQELMKCVEREEEDPDEVLIDRVLEDPQEMAFGGVELD